MKLHKGMKLRVLKDSPIGIPCLKEGDIIKVTSVTSDGLWSFEGKESYWGWCDNDEFEEATKKSDNFNELFTKLNSI